MWAKVLRRFGVWGLLLALASPVTSHAKSSAVRRIDRMWVVGAPVLDAQTPAGVFAWVEDGALQLAAWSAGSKHRTLRVRVQGTRALSLKKLGGFKVVSRISDSQVILQATAKAKPARGSIACKGDITLSDARRGGLPTNLYVGPLAKKAAKSVLIGRF